MAFDYSEFCVLWTYRNAKPDKYAPTSADLDGWDTELGDVYEDKLVAIMNELGIALTRENKSRIVAYAEVSNGTAAGTRLRNGAKFFLATKDLPLDILAAAEKTKRPSGGCRFGRFSAQSARPGRSRDHKRLLLDSAISSRERGREAFTRRNGPAEWSCNLLFRRFERFVPPPTPGATDLDRSPPRTEMGVVYLCRYACLPLLSRPARRCIMRLQANRPGVGRICLSMLVIPSLRATIAAQNIDEAARKRNHARLGELLTTQGPGLDMSFQQSKKSPNFSGRSNSATV